MLKKRLKKLKQRWREYTMLNSPYKIKHVFPSGPVPISYDGWGNVIEYIDPRDMIENKFQGSNPLEFFCTVTS